MCAKRELASTVTARRDEHFCELRVSGTPRADAIHVGCDADDRVSLTRSSLHQGLRLGKVTMNCDEYKQKVAALLAEHEWARLAAAACVLYCSENGHEQTDEIDRAVGFEVDENCE